MIHTVIFSYDRAIQLSNLLDSIAMFDSKNYLKVNVIYSYSTPDFKEAYVLLRKNYPFISWIEEEKYNEAKKNLLFCRSYWHNCYWWLKNKKLRTNKTSFKEDIISSLERSDSELLMFLTDDSVFVREIDFPEECARKIIEHPSGCSFSFRLGDNIAGGILDQTSPDLIQWNVYKNDFHSDWGYPFSVDGHVYHRETLTGIIKKIIFNSPNTMEPNIACYIKERRLCPSAMAVHDSSLTGFELNRVQKITDNHNLNISSEELNDYYLKGYTLVIETSEVRTTSFHPEVKSVFVKKGEECITLYNK